MRKFFNALLVKVSASPWMVTDTLPSPGHYEPEPFVSTLFPV
jgi:hypothetical protein